MAYPRKIRNAARRIWLLGYSDAKVCEQLAKEFPNEKVPRFEQTIIAWRQADEWEKDKDAIIAKSEENIRNEVIETLRQEELEDIRILQLAQSHIRINLTRRDADGRPITITLKEVNEAASALDKLMRRKRINRYGYDVLNIKDLENIEIDSIADTSE